MGRRKDTTTMKLLRSILVVSFAAGALGDGCNVGDKKDCGHPGTQQSDCEASGCCWQPSMRLIRTLLGASILMEMVLDLLMDQEEIAAPTIGMQMDLASPMSSITQCLLTIVQTSMLRVAERS